MNVLNFKSQKDSGQKITMVTCYDYTFARLINETSVDAILVGDSAAMVMHGHKTTLPISVETMSMHIEAVARGADKKFIVGDLPFMSFRKSLSDSMSSIELLMKAGAHAVKLEGYIGNDEVIRHAVESGVPVMGHLGLTPQSVHALGGYRVQGKELEAKEVIKDHARRLQDCGCFSLVLECVPAPLAASLTKELTIPTIGIGAGHETDGQVLVLQDLLGLNVDFKPRFVRQFMKGKDLISAALEDYSAQVRQGRFPSQDEAF